MTDHTPISQVSRLEVISTGARRRWTLAEKQRIVAESYSAPRVVSATARRNGLSGSQLFTWRRLARAGRLIEVEEVPHSRRRLSAGRLRRPVRHRSPNALKVRRTCHTHLVLSVLRAGSRSCWRAGVVWWSTMASI